MRIDISFFLALFLLGQQDEIPELIKKLDSDSFSEREESELKLKRIGDHAIPSLTQALKDSSVERSERARRALQAITSPDFATRKVAVVATGDWGVLGLSFSPDGKILAGSTGESTLLLWDPPTGRTLATLGDSTPDVAALAVAFFPDGKSVVGPGSRGHRMSVWDVATLKERFPLNVKIRPSAIAISPDGRLLATGENGTVRLWDSATGAERGRLDHTGGQIYSMLFTPEGVNLIVASNTLDSSLRVWDVATCRVARILKDPAVVHAIALDPSGRMIAAGNDRGIVRFWDWESGKELARMDRDGDVEVNYVISSLTYSPRGNLLVSGDSDGKLRLFSAASHRRLARFGRGHGWIRSLAFSPDGRLLASSEGILWNVFDIAGK